MQKKTCHLDMETCALCGGDCCRLVPGNAAPEDFGETPEEIYQKLRAALRSGSWKVDWYLPSAKKNWDENPHTAGYFVRPAIKEESREPLHQCYGGGICVFLGKQGCQLKPKERPLGCRLLRPEDQGCFTREEASLESIIHYWHPYQDMLQEILKSLSPNLSFPRFPAKFAA
jgi:hypothetical protein